MTTNTSNIVFDDMFTISDIDKEGKKFDRVSRLYAHSKNYDMELTLDYNIELYPLQKDQSPDGKGRRGLEDDYEYVMYGKVYRFDGGSQEIDRLCVIWGLLMSLTGSFRHLTSIVLGDPVYILLRK
ncbi:uncharacterized protein B0H18DRAFT_971362 [Fomitopsis serialis]|uniref:uncharacterized protein n=1 Tax=Fomitopsis serialis TaxID=139415 RepID=UPI002008AC2F|nr:uncharacterized protein B0H18DRAFT_971362 [Neoantrodia serialis]KAH9937591.1 hypothetical protein B0H18DRAFT_971362 [Neoantrodia serialis]